METSVETMQKQTVLFWFRRDLRLEDNTGLTAALHAGLPVLPVFIFDPAIIGNLPRDDRRISFIYSTLESLHTALRGAGSGLLVRTGSPTDILPALVRDYQARAVYANEDYEPYAIDRDRQVHNRLSEIGADLNLFKDQVIFAKDEVLKKDGTPYTVYTPYSRRWRDLYETPGDTPGVMPARDGSVPAGMVSAGIGRDVMIRDGGTSAGEAAGWYQFPEPPQFPEITALGFSRAGIHPHPLNLDDLDRYAEVRDIPSLDMTSFAGVYLRFGTVSIRRLAAMSRSISDVYFGELIWREFFMQVLYHFPRSLEHNFKADYDGVRWRDDPEDVERWKYGMTGFPIVDAGMRQLRETGYMHNRVRMAAAGFLCKDLLIDWRTGEQWFSQQLFDYEAASNVGNWQWAAGTGCDAVPYFRVFNPETQRKKFDPDEIYIRRWIPEYGTSRYPEPMVDHAAARLRALDAYRSAKAQAHDQQPSER